MLTDAQIEALTARIEAQEAAALLEQLLDMTPAQFAAWQYCDSMPTVLFSEIATTPAYETDNPWIGPDGRLIG